MLFHYVFPYLLVLPDALCCFLALPGISYFFLGFAIISLDFTLLPLYPKIPYFCSFFLVFPVITFGSLLYHCTVWNVRFYYCFLKFPCISLFSPNDFFSPLVFLCFLWSLFLVIIFITEYFLVIRPVFHSSFRFPLYFLVLSNISFSKNRPLADSFKILTKLYRSHYPHRSRDSLSPVCVIFSILSSTP